MYTMSLMILRNENTEMCWLYAEKCLVTSSKDLIYCTRNFRILTTVSMFITLVTESHIEK